MQRRRYAKKTISAYVHWIRRFILFNDKQHPSHLGRTHVEAFLNSLSNKSVISQKQALTAIVFRYKFLRIDLGDIRYLRSARKKRSLPVVLTYEEVSLLLAQLPKTERLMASLMYGSGLRLRECVTLRVRDRSSRNRVSFNSIRDYYFSDTLFRKERTRPHDLLKFKTNLLQYSRTHINVITVVNH